MNSLNTLNRPVTWLTATSLVFAGAIAPNSASAATAEQRCRQVDPDLTRGLQVRERPSPYADPVRVLDASEELTLAANYDGIRGPEGRIWIEIVSPVGGYVSNGTPEGGSNLIQCDRAGQPAPDPEPGPLCRRVLESAGLSIREEPTSNSTLKGDLAPNERFSLGEDYESIEGPEGLSWIGITVPEEGFVVLAGDDGVSNVGYCLDR